MKGQGKIVLVMMMMIMILVNANISIAGQDHEKMNGSNDTYFGVIGNNESEWDDDEFPDAISSEIHRRVLQQVQSFTSRTFIRKSPVSRAPRNSPYRGYSPLSANGVTGCKSQYDRRC